MKKRLAAALMAALMLLPAGNVFAQSPSDDGTEDSMINGGVTKEGEVVIDETTFPDETFRAYVQTEIDDDGDGVLSQAERTKIIIDVTSKKEIKSLQGIEYFPNLNVLGCGKTGITSLDISANTRLTSLYCAYTKLSALDVSNNPNLSTLQMNYTDISELDVSNNPKLKILQCAYTDLSSIDVSNNPNLTELSLDNTNIAAIDVSKNENLSRIECSGTNITALDLSNNPKIAVVYCNQTNLTYLDVSHLTNLQQLILNGCNLYALHLPNTHASYEYCNLPKTSEFTIDALDEDNCFDLKAYFPQIDLARIVAVENGQLFGSVIKAEDLSKPVIYTYDCGTYKEEKRLLSVTLHLPEREPITLKPHDVTIYTGGGQGEDAYSDGLPQLRLDGMPEVITSLTIGDMRSTYTESAEDQAQAAADLQEVLSVSYIGEDGAITDDSQPGVYTSTLNVISLTRETPALQVNDCPVTLDTGTLTIRYVAQQQDAIEGSLMTPLLDEEPTAALHGQGVAVMGKDAHFTINGNADLPVSDTDGIALLDDGLLTQGEDNRQTLMEEKALAYLQDQGIAASKLQETHFDWHYLDLVDSHNGNAWVASDQDTVIYLPYPQGTSADTQFTLLHYPGLHREYDFHGSSLEEAIASCQIESVTVENTAAGIRFVVPSALQEGGGFSPFGLYWTTTPQSTINEIPVIEAKDLTLTVNEVFDAKAGVRAYDKEDGDLTDRIEVVKNEVDTSKVGIYTVTYRVSDTQGAVATKTITVTVQEKEVEQPSTPSQDGDSNGEHQPSTPSMNDTSNDAQKEQTMTKPQTFVQTHGMTYGALLVISGLALAALRVRKGKKS